jgi:hypothetical protein
MKTIATINICHRQHLPPSTSATINISLVIGRASNLLLGFHVTIPGGSAQY